jgi:4-diphosphocytidyl-2C-methyl-D-erythritol kinase
MGAVIGSDVLVINSVIPLVANDYIEVMAVASANSEHQITFTATSGSGATAVPNIPSMIVTVTQLPL